jgi:SAM-dependent methyltransferase
VVGPLLTRGHEALQRRAFRSSASYWEQRYATGGTSGEGSYGALAEFKAEVLNGFVAENAIGSVLEFGCGDGNQLSLASYPRYLGLDVAASAIDLCTARFAGDATKSFLWYDPQRLVNNGAITAELALSLDVIYHLVEDDVFDRHMRQLFGAATRFVGIYASDIDQGDHTAHVRHRKFSSWIAAHQPDWTLVKQVKNTVEDRDTAADFSFYHR